MIKIVAKTEALAFLENMRWFAGYGKISAKVLPDGKVMINASEAAFSNFVWSK